MGRFDGAVVWITGGGSGIGRACALEFVREGATVAVSGRRQDRLDETVAEIEALDGSGLAVPCDVTDPVACRDAVAAVLAAYGKLDVVLANAGYGVVGAIGEIDLDRWHQQLDVNVFGVIHTIQASLPALRETKGRLALVGSVALSVMPKRNGPYSASKAAVRAIGLTLSAELAGSGVTCTTLHPGFVTSEIGQVDNDGVYHPDKRDKRPQAIMWPTDKAARVMVRAIHRRRVEHTFTGHGKVLSFLSRLSPWLRHQIAQRS